MSTGCLGPFSELAGHSVSTRRASLENINRESRPSTRKGKAVADAAKHKRALSVSPGRAHIEGGSAMARNLRLYEDYGLLKLTASIRRKSLWAKAR